jgi:hypothetical protein
MKLQNLPSIWAILAGAFFMFVYSWSRFNTWTDKEDFEYSDPPRHYTTWGRFVSFSLLYTLFIEFFYMLIVFFPEGTVYIDQILGNGTLGEKKGFGEYSFLWAVLILTGVMPNLRWIRDPELAIRHKLHEMAFIPFEGQSIINQFLIHPSLFRPDQEIIKNVIKEMGDEEKYSVEDFNQPTNSIRHKWCKLSYLRFKLMEWQTSRDVERFMCHCNLEKDSFEKTFSDLKVKIEKYNDRLADLGENKPDEYILLLESDITEKLDLLLLQIYRVISCGVLAIEKLGYNRQSTFQSLGLYPALGTDIPFDWNSIINSMAVVFLVTFIPTMLYFFVIRQMDIGLDLIPKTAFEALLWAVYSLVINGIGIIGAIFVKRQSSKIKSTDKLNTSTFHYLGAGLFGYILSFIFLVAVNLIKDNVSIISAVETVGLWPLIPATTAIFTIHYLNTALHLKKPRWQQSLIQSLCTTFVGIAVVCINFNMIFNAEVFAFLVFTTLTTALIGAGIGYTFPEGYRRRIERLQRRTERRIYLRKPVKEQGSLILGNKDTYDCQVVELSLGGAAVDIPVPDPVGTSAQLDLPNIGKLFGWIVRKEDEKTSIQLSLDRNKVDELSAAYNI